MHAPGFHMIPLPFADDLRARPEKVPKTMQTCMYKPASIRKLLADSAFLKRYIGAS